MKKFYIAAVTAALLIIALYGCKKNSPSSPSAPVNTATITLSATISATFTGTPTITETSTVTETDTITETNTCTVTVTLTYTFTITPTPLSSDRTDTINSIASLDGMSSNGGYTNNTGALMNVGDNGSNNMFQSYVDFYLPEMSGPITSATLNVYLTGSNGNPITDIGPVNVAVTAFGIAGFYEYTELTSVGIICASTAPGWYSLDVTAAVDAVRVTGKDLMAFQLYCQGYSDLDSAWDNVNFATTESGGNAPTLVIVHK